MDPTIWNLFHDGSIVSIEDAAPGDLSLTVEIEYLRKMFELAGASFVVTLRHCELISLASWADDSVITDPAAIRRVELEILSGEDMGDHVMVICDGYELRLRYSAVEPALDSGTAVTVDELVAAAEKYWREWGERIAR